MKCWILATQDGDTKQGGDKRIMAYQKLLDLLPRLTDTTQVWQVDLTDNVSFGDWSVKADKVTYLQKYDVMSVIHDVGAMVVDDFAGISQDELNSFFLIAEGINNFMCGVPNLQGIISNTAAGFGQHIHRDQIEYRKAKYNMWLESALKASIPNSLVSG